jgi:glutamine---fructose-6-phosphate transaminase (isomerizing)
LSDRKDVYSSAGPGAYTQEEILSQPRCWSQCLEALKEKRTLEQIRENFAKAEEWLFIGCGSSYYIAQSAAASWSMITGQRSRALPASELLLFPELALAASRNIAPVLISRSGLTSEVLKAGEFLEGKKKIKTLGVTCAADQPLAHLASSTLTLPPADEKSMVMTRSVTSMILALQCLAALFAEDQALTKALHQLPPAAEKILPGLHPRLRSFVNANQFADYVSLAQGPLYGLACESTLKLTEMSVSYGQAFRTLEFRHGPKSIVGPETLLLFLLSETGYQEECEVLQEMKSLGATTVVVTNRADDSVRAAADVLVELSLDLPELARVVPHIFAGQLLGLHTGLKKGLDPDSPRNLSRVVILNQGSPA